MRAMAVYEKTTKQYRVVVGNTSRGATIYILNPAIARKFGTNCVFSYDGKTWIKTSGGRSLSKFNTEGHSHVCGGRGFAGDKEVLQPAGGVVWTSSILLSTETLM